MSQTPSGSIRYTAPPEPALPAPPVEVLALVVVVTLAVAVAVAEAVALPPDAEAFPAAVASIVPSSSTRTETTSSRLESSRTNASPSGSIRNRCPGEPVPANRRPSESTARARTCVAPVS